MNTIEKVVDKLATKDMPTKTNTKRGNGPGRGSFVENRQPGVTSRTVQLNADYFNNMGVEILGSAASVLREDYRRIKRPLLANAFNTTSVAPSNGNLVMVTSSFPGEGKTFTSINLAMSIAMEMDKTVLLVDADVLRPSVTSYLGIDVQVGLVDYLAGETAELSDYLLRTNIRNFNVLPAGRRDLRSAELLASDRMRILMSELATRYKDRIVIFDAPPILAANEACILAGLVGQVAMVVEANKTPKSALNEALSRIDQQKPVGLILNKRSSPGKDYASYYGYYGYEK